MKINITEKKENPLLSRTEIKANIEYEKETPSRAEIREKLAAKLGEKEDKLIIIKVETAFGKRTAEIDAELYKDEKVMNELVQKYMIKKHKKEEVKVEEKSEAPAEASSEKPAEEKKEEPVKEENKEEVSENKQDVKKEGE